VEVVRETGNPVSERDRSGKQGNRETRKQGNRETGDPVSERDRSGNPVRRDRSNNPVSERDRSEKKGEREEAIRRIGIRNWYNAR